MPSFRHENYHEESNAIPETVKKPNLSDSITPPGDNNTRQEIVDCGRRLFRLGLLTQTSGNLSVKLADGDVYITPTSMEYELIQPGDIAVIGRDGVTRQSGVRGPSSETPLHRLIYETRPDATAVVHTHSPYATTLAVLGLPIPAVHYMIATLETTEIAVAEYATYGTSELARNVCDAFKAPSRAVLIANHGLVAIGDTLDGAARAAEVVETLASLYYRALAIGTPKVLTQQQMSEVLVKYHAKQAS
jgi:L-fuculose-phosphate aldolase